MTFSLLLTDPAHRWIVVASATCTPAVGAAVPAARIGAGGVVSQAHTNSALRASALALLAEGLDPATALERTIATDARAELRQVGLLDARGRAASHTGTEVTPWCGARSRAGVLAIGNYLTGPEVIDALLDSVAIDALHDAESGPGGLATIALSAMHAAQDVGGDRRGQQSASLLLTALTGPSRVEEEDGTLLDLRVDDNERPLGALTVQLHRSIGDLPTA